MNTALILSNAKAHDVPGPAPDILVTCSRGFDEHPRFKYCHKNTKRINVTCDAAVTSELIRHPERVHIGVQFFYSSWNAGACNYFRDDLYHLPFVNRWSSGNAAVLLMAYFGVNCIELSKGIDTERNDGKHYTMEQLQCFQRERKELIEVLRDDFGYRLFNEDDERFVAAQRDPKTVKKQRQVNRLFG